jgi:hypothetical protein
MDQLNDSGATTFYKGKNLLSASDNMTVRFGNNHTLVVNSFDGTVSAEPQRDGRMWFGQ